MVTLFIIRHKALRMIGGALFVFVPERARESKVKNPATLGAEKMATSSESRAALGY